MREVRIEWTEFRSPKPCVESSILSAPAIKIGVYADFRIGTFFIHICKKTLYVVLSYLSVKGESLMRGIRLNGTNEYNAEEMITEFLLLQEQKRVVKTTLRSHKYALLELHDGCTGIPTEQDLRRCLRPNISNAYYNKKLSTYKQYYEMLIDFGKTQFNPTIKWNYKRISFNIKNYDECKVKEFINAIDKSTFAGLRDYTMCLFILDTGIRPSEVVQLRKEDIGDGQVHLRSEITKTRTARTVPISDYVLRELRKLHQYELKSWNNSYVFCSSDGDPITTLSFRHNIRKVALKSGISLTPYDFRHIFATTYIRNGGDAFTLQRIMGHTKPSMTMVYVNLNADDLSVAHKKINPLSNFISRRISKIK